MCKLPALLVLISLVILGGCSSGGETPVRYYLIEPTTVPTNETDRDLTIQIVDLEVSQYLDRFQIASRKTDSQISFASSHQWAESLRKNLTRTLARNLTNLLGASDVGTPSNRTRNKPDFRVTVYIESFERQADGYIELTARWQLVNHSDNQAVVSRSSNLQSDSRVSASDYSASVDEMSTLFGDLSRTIATEIETGL